MFGIPLILIMIKTSVGAINGDVEITTTLDGDTTNFDLGFTTFGHVQRDKGIVYVYEYYYGNYVYGDSVNYTPISNDSIHDNYGFGKYPYIKIITFMLDYLK